MADVSLISRTVAESMVALVPLGRHCELGHGWEVGVVPEQVAQFKLDRVFLGVLADHGDTAVDHELLTKRTDSSQNALRSLRCATRGTPNIRVPRSAVILKWGARTAVVKNGN
jgi:hypothetical protein